MKEPKKDERKKRERRNRQKHRGILSNTNKAVEYVEEEARSMRMLNTGYFLLGLVSLLGSLFIWDTILFGEIHLPLSHRRKIAAPALSLRSIGNRSYY